MKSVGCQRNRNGLTLVEILIGLAMTLVVLVAMMRGFRFMSTEIAKGRAMIELSNQLRTAQDLLRSDLAGATVDLRTWSVTANPKGYVEYIEGPILDKNAAPDIMGDFDDVLALTTRSEIRPFRGRYRGQVLESNLAEVVWFTDFEDRPVPAANNIADYDETITLRRRVLLIRPDLGNLGPSYSFLTNDVSARFDPIANTWVANSLDDLANRGNRYAHNSSSFPHNLQRSFLFANRLSPANLVGFDVEFAGQDIVSTDITAFNVQAYSVDCPVYLSTDYPTFPADSVYNVGGTIETYGSFVDLNFTRGSGSPTCQFSGPCPSIYREPSTNYLTGATENDDIYDTFSKHFEYNGIDDDGNGIIDQAMDGTDNGGTSGVIDDNAEREVYPPYSDRLTGLKVGMRIIERTTKQVRQTSVVSSFVPN